MATNEKDKKDEKGPAKGPVEEKRVKSTVIRRRTAPAPVPEVKLEVKPEAAPEVKAPPVTPPAAEERPVHRGAAKAAAAGEKKEAKKPLVKGKGRPAPRGGKKSEAGLPFIEEAEAEVEAEAPIAQQPFVQAPKAEARIEEKAQKPSEVKPVEGEKAAVSKKEIKVFEKEPELKKFYTAKRPTKKDRHFQTKDNAQRRAAAQAVQARPLKKTEITVLKAAKRVIRIVDAISVGDLSQRLGVKAGDIIKKLMTLGIMANVNQLIDADAVSLVASDYGFEVESVAVPEDSLIEQGVSSEEAAANLTPRAPVVTVMGHVDHGKTSLLDAIRKTNVVGGEAGGITQHIGAYHVHLEKGDVTFLDTPGHEAFTSMRARGAKATDIVVLVVAADDGVKPQTIEAINHAKAANVPIIVAINKIDLPGADAKRVKNELTGYGLQPEEWGGGTIYDEVSAKKGIHIKELLEMILLQAEVLELKANLGAPARGVIVEAKLDKGRGPVATVLIQNGTLRVGDAFVTGIHSGRVRAMISDWGKRIEEAGPSMPIEILGLSGVPQAGDAFSVVKDEVTAKQIAGIRQKKSIEKDRMKTAKVTLEALYDKISKGEVKELNLIVKADVNGSLEAINETLGKIHSENVKLKLLHSGVGGISEGDVMLAAASSAIIIGFNVRPESKAQALADAESVDVRLYNIIYNLADDIKNAMEGLLAPIVREEIAGHAEIREVFRVSKVGTIAGCYVTDGKALRGASVRLIRSNVVIYDGKLSSLKRFKDDAKEVATGYECGMSIEGYNDIKVGDVIELYTVKEEAAKL
ncbi:MAG: translation initiation factor IF-2 [Deltaproteobacteria bacterium]|nr:translation initiation factor IF-2 [Deltaproteobacteria bacterium]